MPSPPGPLPPGPRPGPRPGPPRPVPRPISPGPRIRNRSLSPPPPAKEPVRDPRPPQEIIDEFWKDFSAEKPSKATTVIPQNEYAEKAAKNCSRAPERTTQSSYAEAAAICRTKVKKIADECRAINRKYRDPHFDLESDLKLDLRDCLESLSNRRPGRRDEDEPLEPPPLKPMGVKRVADIFDEPRFFIDGPSTNDVRQGKGGDCWLLAALCTLSNKEGLIDRICVARDEQVGVYGFVFHRDGEWFSEIIDDKLYLKRPDYDESFIERMIWEDRDRVDSEEAYRRIYQSGSGALYFSQCADPNETWLPLLEKCYAKAHGDYSAIDGGFTGEGIEDLTGGVTTEIYTSDILDREAFWRDELMQVNREFLFGCSTGIWGRGREEQKGILALHAYSVMRAVEADGCRLVLLKNPWGKGEWKGPWSDGSKEWTPEWIKRLDHKFGDDGAFWISYADLLRKYQSFDRTRLFGDDWRVASIWTTLAIPWKHDYHDTHFAFTLAADGEVVIVLSQLDDRYFRGLEGQYTFSLAFRLHRSGQEDYIVRTPPGYRMKRSVNVEVKLEAGDYTVMVKVDAAREDKLLPVQDVIRENAKERREKLLRIGLAYDLAHSKGRYVETPEEKAAREAREERAKNKKRREARKSIMKRKFLMRYINMKKEEKFQKDEVRAREVKRVVHRWEDRRRGRAGGWPGSGPVGGPGRGPGREQYPPGYRGGPPPHPYSGAPDRRSQWVPPDRPQFAQASRPFPAQNGDRRGPEAAAYSRDHGGRHPPRLGNRSSPPSAEVPMASEEKHQDSDPPPAEIEDASEVGGERQEPRHRGTSGRDDGDPKPDHPSADRQPSRQLRRGSEMESFMTAQADAPPVVQEPEDYPGSDSESTVSDSLTISTISDVSEREIDLEVESQDELRGPPGGPMLPPLPPQNNKPGSSFRGRSPEGNPWNAVVVVGLRIYHKIPEGATDKEEVVKLRVVRPIPLSDDEDDSSGDEAGKGGEEKQKRPRRLVSEMSKGLDVDDSAKDATLAGTENERKLSIDPKQAKHPKDNKGRRRSRMVLPMRGAGGRE
ncbi:related to micromolar calcium activated neutral protease 1 (capn1) [Cephalotrichum gorgonifer]|uniref:Related to micromolar calcium activated neutral protease 1 (Capn1) n=1 Tax=Cephalotrichum gorgonifer TaxID=2041049 RepID=A0AAE8MTF8_9PEZI|nr:related to micromolar calcium activated neutral protease 1 (capn1) [Cephalotrichum gorgonifer]